ncbi:MAG: prolipoprotein diacylglyceryl transferase [Chloroflexi bacterium]|nr:prolipoprotein diacylglyceryl transferase [Chloroflexota bacterium]
MYPILFQIGGVTIYSHGFFMLMGFLVGGAWLLYEAKRRNWTKEEMVPIGLAAFVGGMIGARLVIPFFNGLETASVAFNFYLLFDPRIGPGSILGGVAGGYIGGYVAAKAIGKKECTCDAFAPALALALAVGRIGDFLAAEDGLGIATELPWGVPVPGVDFLVHPTPLYDSAFNLLWFGVLVTLRDHPKMQNGNLLKFGLAGYAVFRFLVEFVRNNRVLGWGMTGQQYFSFLILAAIILYYVQQWRSRNQAIAA